MPDVLGPEWGPLAGRTTEEALKLTTNYATSLEEKLGLNEEEEKPEEQDSLQIAKGMNVKSKAPIGAEYVGNREAAKAAARQELKDNDPSFNDYESYIETVMANMSADQQTDKTNWIEAYWYIWGQAQRIQKNKPVEETIDAPPGSEHVEEIIHEPSVNVARSTPRGRQNVNDQYRIDDPVERRTKQKFDQLLGKKMSDEEWHRLQHEDIKTIEDYNELQEDLKRAG